MNYKINLKTNHKILLHWGKNAKAQGQVIIILPKTEDLANKSVASFPPFTPHRFTAATSLTSHRLVSPPETLSWSQSRCRPTPSKQCSRHLSDWPVCLRLQEEPSDGVCDRCLSGTMHLVCIHVRAPSLRAADRDGCLHVQALRESERM